MPANTDYMLAQEKKIALAKIKAEKWTWVIGLTLAAWGLIYWSQKQPNK
jgi:hypothetical protein